MDYAMAGGQTLILLYKRIHNTNQCRSGRLFLNRSGHSRKGNQQDKCPVYVRQKPCFNVCCSHSYMQKCTHYFIRCYNGNVDSTDS